MRLCQVRRVFVLNEYGSSNYTYRILVSAPNFKWIELGDVFIGDRSVKVDSIKIQDGNVFFALAGKDGLVVYSYDLNGSRLSKQIDIELNLFPTAIFCSNDICYVGGESRGEMVLVKVENGSKKINKVSLNGMEVSDFYDLYLNDGFLFIAGRFILNKKDQNGLLAIKNNDSLYAPMPDFGPTSDVRFLGNKEKTVYLAIRDVAHEEPGKVLSVFATDFASNTSYRKFSGVYKESYAFFDLLFY